MSMNKVGHLIISLLFVAFAAVQYNDADGIKWILIYLVVALLPILRIIKKDHLIITSIVSAFFLLLLIFTFSDLTDWLDAGRPAFIDYEPTNIKEVEGIREFLGLVISTFCSSFYCWLSIKQKF